MKIIIAGAGDVGFHLAQLLSIEDQAITLVDLDEEVLQYAATHLDVLTIRGDCSSVSTLQQAGAAEAELFLAVTTHETSNLLAAIMAKKMGAKKTIARVNNPEFLEPQQKENFKELGVDTLISPQELAALEIERLLGQTSLTDLYEFEGGKISIVGFQIDHGSPFEGRSIAELSDSITAFRFRALALRNGNTTLVPRGNTTLRGADYLYVALDKKNIEAFNLLAGKKRKPIKKVMIVGATWLASRTAQRLEEKYNISIVASGKEDCRLMVDKLQKALVVRGNPSNIDLLKEEGLERMDVFIALTENSETNIVTSLMAKEVGVHKTIAMVDNAVYTHISKNIGVDTIINKKLIAANNIFRFVRKGKVEAISSLHGVESELIEFSIHHESELTRKPIREIYFPEDAIIAGVVRNEVGYIPKSDFQLEVGDKVVVFALLHVIPEVEEIFK